MASVRDCNALADAQPVEVTNAKMPWFISSQAAGEKREGEEKEVRNLCHLLVVFHFTAVTS